MITQRDIFLADNLRLPEMGLGFLFEQLRWLIVLRWFAILGIILVSNFTRYSLAANGGTGLGFETIRLDSEIGKGTTVTLSIPIRPKNHLIGDSSKEQARPQNPESSSEKPS